MQKVQVKDCVNYFSISYIPVPRSIEINEAHVIPRYFTNLLAIFLDVPINVILSFHLIRSDIVVSIDIVLVVMKFNLSGVLVTHRAHEDVPDVVARPA